MGEICGWFGYEGYGGDGQRKEMFSEDDRRTEGNASVPPPRKVLASLPPHKLNGLIWLIVWLVDPIKVFTLAGSVHFHCCSSVSVESQLMMLLCRFAEKSAVKYFGIIFVAGGPYFQLPGCVQGSSSGGGLQFGRHPHDRLSSP